VELISVVVPVRNEGAFLGHLLKQLLTQEFDSERYEVIVVDGHSTDDTREVVRALQAEHPNLHLLDNPMRWSSRARNIGVRLSRGDAIVIVDGHCELDGCDFLKNISEAFERTGADCLGRPQPQDVSKASSLQRGIAAARASRLGHHPASFIYSSEERYVPAHSVAVAYRRWVFDRVGLFDESFDACEDVELNHRIDSAGMKCFFTPGVRVRYHPRATLPGLFKQMARYGRGRIRLSRKHPESLSLASIVPMLFLVGLAGGPLVSLLSSSLRTAFLAVILLYGVLVALSSLAIVVRMRDVRLLPWLPLAYVTVHLGVGYGALREFLTGQARPRKEILRAA
jgi:succinoglycan biosynthesis protein ExoA